jgi:hypothetical protein
MTEEFPDGFSTVSKTDMVKHRGTHVKLPKISLTKSGYLVLNIPAASFFSSGSGIVRMAYNPDDGVLAIRNTNVPAQPPEVLKITPAGAYRRHGAIGFKTLARIWHIAMDGSHYVCTWDAEKETLFVDLTQNNPE